VYIAWSILFAAFPLIVCYSARALLARSLLQPVWVFPALFAAGAAGGWVFGTYLISPLSLWFSGFVGLVHPETVALALVAPVAEEIGKGFVLLLFLPTRWFRSSVDGLLYGLAAGSGFAMVENLLYFVYAYARGGSVDLLSAIVLRLPAALLVHGGCTAILGGWLGAVRWARRPLVVFGALPAALFMSTAIHGGWNVLMHFAVRHESQAHLVGAVLLLAAVAVSLAVVLWWSLRVEARDVRAELAPEIAAGRIDKTSAELAVVLSAGAWRRERRPAELHRESSALVSYAFALRRARREGRAGPDIGPPDVRDATDAAPK
jgi:RsiW-degrading membrane proteinase PrsW (M82 family)